MTTADAGYCWGGGKNAPTPIDGPADVLWQSFVAGPSATCGLAVGGDGYCWGNDYGGRLGNGPDLGTSSSPTPIDAPEGVAWRQLTIGAGHGCGVSTTGDAHCWGSGASGQLGNGSGAGSESPVAVAPAGVEWTSIHAGGASTCAITTGGELYCWGSDGSGQLGNGPDVTGDQLSPSLVAGVDVEWVTASVGSNHACGVTTDGSLYCWGAGPFGQLGTGAFEPDPLPAPVEVDTPEGVTWASVSAGTAHTCAATTDGRAYCWGSRGNGRVGLGPGLTDDVPSPQQVAGLPQTITFEPLGDVILGSDPFAVSAIASSGLPVELSAGGPCTVDGATVTATAEGECTITATQPGDDGWAPAAPVARTFTVLPVDTDAVAPVVTIDAPPPGSPFFQDFDVTFTVDDPTATVEASVDGGAWSPASSPLAVGAELDIGVHRLTVRATDPAGNAGSDTAAWTMYDQRICDIGPKAPDLKYLDARDVLPMTSGDGYPVEVAILTDLAADPATATYTPMVEVDLGAYVGDEVRVVARVIDDPCEESFTFDAVYDVRDAYPSRPGSTGFPGGASPAIAYEDLSTATWPVAVANYWPGGDVAEQWQNPETVVGGGGLVVLGNGGAIDLVFDPPIADGPGPDLAVLENGFAVGTGEAGIDFLELAYTLVSSDGVHWATFDSASRRATAVGAFEGQYAYELGGLAGKDIAGYGTPFDLTNLRNSDEVRAGEVDLDAITHVRVSDVIGDGAWRDSFGRPIYDAYPTGGSGGFDLTGVAVLNQAEPEPVAPVDAAFDWLERELTDNGGTMPGFSPGVTEWGLTIDAILALAAGGRGDGAAATTATDLLAANVDEYSLRWGSTDVVAGATGKILLAALLEGRDGHDLGGVDVEARVRASMRTDGIHRGRFSDGGAFDNSNGFGTVLNVLALSHTEGGVPAAAVDFLLAQQCPSGGFRLTYDVAPVTRRCEDDARADSDTTAFTVQALLAVEDGPAVRAAVARAVGWLLDRQDAAAGGFGGTGPTAAVNSNSTGLAGQALRAVDEDAAAERAAGYLESVQLLVAATAGTPAAGDHGAIAYDRTAYDQALSGGISAGMRDQWRRATPQAVLGYGVDLFGGPAAPAAAPEVTITSRPPVLTTATSATVGFTVDDPAATVDCRLDGAAWAPCTSPATFARVAVGNHQLEVRAADPSGNAATAVVAWTVNAAPEPGEPGEPGETPAGVVAVTPARLADTRVGEVTVDGVVSGVGRLGAGSVLEVPVAGRAGVPGDAVAAVFNVTVVGAEGPRFATVWACGDPRPVASSVNFVDGGPYPNAVVSELSGSGSVCVYVLSGAEVIVDVNGYFT